MCVGKPVFMKLFSHTIFQSEQDVFVDDEHIQRIWSNTKEAMHSREPGARVESREWDIRRRPKIFQLACRFRLPCPMCCDARLNTGTECKNIRIPRFWLKTTPTHLGSALFARRGHTTTARVLAAHVHAKFCVHGMISLIHCACVRMVSSA